MSGASACCCVHTAEPGTDSMKRQQVGSCAIGSPDDAGGLLIPAALLRGASGALEETATPQGPAPLEPAGFATDEHAAEEELLNNVVSSPRHLANMTSPPPDGFTCLKRMSMSWKPTHSVVISEQCAFLQAWGFMHVMDVPADEELASATTSMLDDAHFDSRLCSLQNGVPWA